MRFVLLQNEDMKSPYDNIRRNGCGPNFVLSRQREFEQMIREQDLVFWFRFWLLFCFDPGSESLKTIQDQWPGTAIRCKLAIHDTFLLGSIHEACNFCINSVSLLKPPTTSQHFKSCIQHLPNYIKPKESANLKSEKGEFHRLLQEYFEMAFGVAICDVFYKWLRADKHCGKYYTYWIIPEHYLCSNFIPGEMEVYLAKVWQGNLISLLGIDTKRASWIKKLLHQLKKHLAVAKMIECDKFYDYSTWNRELNLAISSYRAGIKKISISPSKTVDKKPPKNLLGKVAISNGNLICSSKSPKSKCGVFKLKKKRSFRKCCHCFIYENAYRRFKKCKLCVEERWPKPKYYCSRACQIEDWYATHENEHCCFAINAFSSSDDD